MHKSLLTTVSGLALLLSISAWAGNINNLRGERYCEIILGSDIQKASKTSQAHFVKPLKVYNTIGLNNCPENLWVKIDPEKIKTENGATTVKLNGPRVWVIDGMKTSALVNPTVVTFNGIEMRQAAVLELPLRFLLKRPSPYHSLEVARNTTWVYKAGKPVFELLDPKGNIFIMQSYSLEKMLQTQEDLLHLGSKLKLPKDWHFRTRVLDQDYLLTPVNQQAVVLQDDLANTYQQEVK